MSFEEFQNRARLYVIGALEPEETEEFEQARKEYRRRRPRISSRECYNLHEAFALSLQPEKSSDALKQRLMSMVRQRQGGVAAAMRLTSRPCDLVQDELLQEAVEVHLE